MCSFSFIIEKIIVFLGEHLSWKKITYLKDIQRNFGSPFDLGLKNNLACLIRGLFLKENFDWKFVKVPKGFDGKGN